MTPGDPPAAGRDRAIAVVLKGYPRLSETFIAEELAGLERAGLDLRLFSMRHPTDRKRHPVHDQVRAPVRYLPEYLYREPLRVLRALRAVRRRPRFGAALRTWLGDLVRDPTPNRVRRFGQAAVLAAELPDDVAWIYAHFIHTPSAVARYASLITGLPWSCSAHAKDIWTSRDRDLAASLASARWAVTCTRTGRDRLAGLAPAADRVRLLYHGLDLERFGPCPEARPARDGSDAAAPVRLLAVGRAVDKKGFDLLLEALARLPAGLHWEFSHIGGGDGLARLKTQAARLGVAGRLHWLGARDQREVLAAYRAADLFALPCRIADSGDRDGLPNVLVEAQSQGLACLSTPVGGVPELIEDGVTGLLVAPDDVGALAAGLERLMRDPALRARLGSAGEARVRERFDSRQSIAALSALLARSLEAVPEHVPAGPVVPAAAASTAVTAASARSR